MGLLAAARSGWLYFALYVGGGLLGAAGLWLALGPGFAGVGLSTGILLGLMGFLAYSRLFLRTKAMVREQGALRPEDALLMASAVGALMAHVTEISFGIAIVST